MENKIIIPVYTCQVDKFKVIDEEEYIITYSKGNKAHQLRIVVNGMLSTFTINLLDFNQGYKTQLLKAISEFKNKSIRKPQQIKKTVSLDFMKNLYSKSVNKRIHDYLLPINKESSRDELTKFKLI